MKTMKSVFSLLLILATPSAWSAERCEFIFSSRITLSHIVATSSNFVIGNAQNKMPWGHALKQDLKRFKDLTSNHIVIMGRKTFESMYDSLNGKPLPNRLSVVITRDPSQIPIHKDVIAVKSVEEAMLFAESQRDNYPSEVFVVGGGEIFAKTYDKADRLYLTLIEQSFEGAIFYPKVDMNRFNILEREMKEEAGHRYQFLTLETKK